MNLDKELDQQHKKVQILRTEIENNEQRCNNIQDVLMNKEENISRTHAKLGEATSCIQDLKYQLNKLDGELGYFESQNEQHKNAQTQLFKGNEYEYVQSKENTLRQQELVVQFQKCEQDEQSVQYEIDRLKSHSEQMMRDQIDLQAEVDALDKHMANLNNQNYCLQKELEGFIEADDQVRQRLDRKNQVENIRTRVDDVIRRSQYEVESRVVTGRDRSANKSYDRTSKNMGSIVVENVESTGYLKNQNPARFSSKSATHYSPPRQNNFTSSYGQNRVAYQ